MPDKLTDSMTIGKLALTIGINVESIRFYQRKGLLRQPSKSHGSVRRYTPDDISRIRFIKSAQRLGFSLDEIAELLRLQDGTQCRNARTLAEHKLKDVRAKINDLQQIEKALSGLVKACGSQRGFVTCPIIASLWET